MKIAIVGSHPETWVKAPFGAPAWQIWGFSRRNHRCLPRFDKWFELHTKQGHFQQAYLDWMAANSEKIVSSSDFPKDELVAKYGEHFFHFGQIPWLIAYAIEQKPEAIGLWGMEAIEPYHNQRHEIRHFVGIARLLGIEVIAPHESKLLERETLYAFS